jgi:RNA polymerase sigma-70 factor (ECF subfamily)
LERERREEVQRYMVRLADGDRDAFSPLYEALWPIVRGFAERALGHAADAEDAAQLALMKIFTRAAEFDVERDALAWVLGVTAYECRSYRKKRLRRREQSVEEPELVALGDPANDLIARDLQAAAWELLGQLPPEDAETLRALVEGRRPDIAPPTFRKRVQRALTRLRAAWSSRHGVD